MLLDKLNNNHICDICLKVFEIHLYEIHKQRVYQGKEKKIKIIHKYILESNEDINLIFIVLSCLFNIINCFGFLRCDNSIMFILCHYVILVFIILCLFVFYISIK